MQEEKLMARTVPWSGPGLKTGLTRRVSGVLPKLMRMRKLLKVVGVKWLESGKFKNGDGA
jgi:hypothetical protein